MKTRLLTESLNTKTLVITAIHGLGSIGKSTLAAALAHDQEVQTHFCDGILWATLGQQPNLLSLLSGWVQALGDYNFKATSTEAASNQLRTLLYDKAVLLVVDDAWNTEDAQAFNVGGARCQVLVTTRESVIADVLGASTYSLDVMTPSQAMELLTKKLGREIIEAERQLASDLAKELGYLPLALELAASQFESGVSWALLLQDIQGEIARLKTFDRPGARDVTDEASLKRLSLTASLNLSIQRLPLVTRENFIWLGILPEDVNITQKMTATLWDMDDERDAADELRYLHSKALLLSGVPLIDGTPTYRLHDLFHDLARNLLTAPPKPKRQGNLPGLGIALPAAHAIFLEKYRNLTNKNLWHTLPSDAYIHQHLVWHLEKAEKLEEIHSLLREDSETGGNGWYEACDRLGQTANFVTDVARAWQLAEDLWTEATPSQVIGLQCRYALIITSLNSLSVNVPVELLIASIKKNVWTPEQGLAYVLQSSNPEKKANLLTELANHFPRNLKKLVLSKALATAREIQSESSRADALIRLADKLPELFPEVLAATREIQSESSRADALIRLADKLPELFPEALTAAREIQSESSRADALIRLADKLPELFPEALAAAREIQSESSRADALIRLAKKLPELFPEALAAAREIHNRSSRENTLHNLAVVMPPELLPEILADVREIRDNFSRMSSQIRLADNLPPELLPEVLAAAREIRDDWHRAQVLIRLAKKLPELLPEVLAAATEIQSDWSRANALSYLADELPELLPEVLAAAREIRDDKHRADALRDLAYRLPELLPEALAATREIRDDKHRADALRDLAYRLPELLPEALAATREIRDDKHRAHALRDLAYRLRLPELFPEVLAAAREIRDDKHRAHALSYLADELPELFPEVLAATREIRDDKHRAHALRDLADKLPRELLPEALATAREIHDEEECAQALRDLADNLPRELLPEALATAREIHDEEECAQALRNLADKLPRELLPEALAAAIEIQSESSRADALRNLADKLPELLPEILGAAREIHDGNDYYPHIISTLAHNLPPELLPMVLAAAREIDNKRHRVRVLSSLANKLSDLLPEALAVAREIHDDLSRAVALIDLADKLPPDLLLEALAVAREIHDDLSRAPALSRLANKLSQIKKTPLFSHWRDTLHILSLRTRKDLLTDIKALTPVIFALGDKLAVKDTANAIQDVSRWWN